MRILSQRDPQWSAVKLGGSNIDIGHYGCTTCSISMLSDYFGSYVAPDTFAHNAAHYTPAGLILWNKIDVPKMKFDWRDYKRDDAKIMEYLRDPNKAVILNVDDGKHWVVAIRKEVFGNDYVVADPWTGKKVSACKVWKNITGAAYFSRK